MKKLLSIVSVIVMTFSLCACGQNVSATESEGNRDTFDVAAQLESTKQEAEREEHNTENEQNELNVKETSPITLTIGDTVLNGYLNNSIPAQSLISQLPLTVTLNDSDNDFCGGSLDIEYTESDVQSGYKNGDLAFWTPADNFVIFVDDEENSADTGNLVILGKITESQEVLEALEGTIDVTIANADSSSSFADKTEVQTDSGKNNTVAEETNVNEITETDRFENPAITSETEVAEVRVKITVGETELIAVMEDNATTQAIIEQMPMTLSMMDLYGREMCYRYGAYALPTDNLRSDGYEVGDVAYWAPGGSLVILYKQNGEQFERQHLGHIDSGVEIFESTGDVDVTFELVTD